MAFPQKEDLFLEHNHIEDHDMWNTYQEVEVL